MPRAKPERIAGIVALSYLALIPIGAFLAWQKIHAIDKDVTSLWHATGMIEKGVTPAPAQTPFQRLKGLFNNVR